MGYLSEREIEGFGIISTSDFVFLGKGLENVKIRQ
jgi:hypothetical protein